MQGRNLGGVSHMVLNSKQTTVAYRCPKCGAGVMSVVGLFNLCADMVRLKCDCGQSEMTMVYTKDSKVHFTVPCMFCPNPHRFTLNSSVFFEKEFFALPCPYSGMNIVLMGESDRVKAELAKGELELLKAFEEAGISGMGEQGKIELTDPEVLDIITYIVKELDEEGKIECRCQNQGEGDYELEFLPDGIKLSCKKCNASVLLPTNSLIDAYELLGADKLVLK